MAVFEIKKKDLPSQRKSVLYISKSLLRLHLGV